MTQLTSSNHLTRSLEEADPEVAALIRAEDRRQRDGLQLIASENFASVAVLQAVGSCLTNKYAEGRPGKRYYAGCENADQVERLTEERARQVFATDYHVNAQPHSGTQANLSVFLMLLSPGDPILAMDLAMGGHLSHGSPFNASGKLYVPHFYGVDRESERIDYDAVAELARKVKPKLVVCGASAYPRDIDFARFGAIAHEVGALMLADISHIAGLVAAGEHSSPFGNADFVTTTTHKTLRGPRGGLVFCRPKFKKKVNSAIFPGTQGGPLMHQIAGKAVALKEALEPDFAEYQRSVRRNARALGTGLADRGYRLVSGGTDNHMVLVDLTGRMTGAEADDALHSHHIYVNKNLIPYDPLPSSKTSGIRLGTPAMTARGLTEEDFHRVADLVADVLEGRLDDVERRVRELCA